jgi:chromosome segregation ATPase
MALISRDHIEETPLSREHTETKAAYVWLKENGAPEEYVDGVRRLIESWELLDSENSRLTDDLEDITRVVKRQESDIEVLQNTLSTLERSLKDTADDLVEASRAIQKLV